MLLQSDTRPATHHVDWLSDTMQVLWALSKVSQGRVGLDTVRYPVCVFEYALKSSKRLILDMGVFEDIDGQTPNGHDDGWFPPAQLLRSCRRQTRSGSGVCLKSLVIIG